MIEVASIIAVLLLLSVLFAASLFIADSIVDRHLKNQNKRKK